MSRRYGGRSVITARGADEDYLGYIGDQKAITLID
jgi:hypothetical protein